MSEEISNVTNTPQTANVTYNSHIFLTDLGANYTPLWDYLIAGTMILCTLAGAPTNILALKYFLSKKKRDLATSLYIAICVVDTATCFTHLPVTLVLLKGRVPVLFNVVAVCASWKLLFSFLQQFSMFLVALMSVSRTLAIVLPFYRVSKRTCIIALNFYLAVLIIIDCVESGLSELWYDSDSCFCYFSARDPNWGIAIEALWSTKVGVPAIVSFISFIIMTVKMFHNKQLDGGAIKGKEGHLKRAAVTVSLFTGLFLLCNLPFFIITALYAISLCFNYSYPEPFFSTDFMRLYSWVVAKVLFTVFNAALNPLLYYCRMERFKVWLSNKVSDSGSSTNRMSGDLVVASLKTVMFSRPVTPDVEPC
ncbi:hypothetical protein ACHWQZ_G012739 [Mnemiopsis leidyi]